MPASATTSIQEAVTGSPGLPLSVPEPPVDTTTIDELPRLALRDITVSFDGLTVLDTLSLTLARGEMRFLIGPNGAGKTTLLDVITGKTQPRSGTVHFGEFNLDGWQEHDIAQRGIGRKFQTPTIFPSLSVEQNMEIAVGARGGILGALRRMPLKDRELVAETLHLIGL